LSNKIIQTNKAKEKAFELAYNYEKKYWGCAPCTVAAAQELFGFDEAVFKCFTTFSAEGCMFGEGICGDLLQVF